MAERMTVVWSATYENPGDFAEATNDILAVLNVAEHVDEPQVQAIQGEAGLRVLEQLREAGA